MSIPMKYCRIDATTSQCNTGTFFFHLLTVMLIPNILLKLFEIKECNFQHRYIQLTEGHKQCLTDVMEFMVLID